MDWLSFSVGMGGVVVAALALILSFLERRSSMRQLVFEKQFEAYQTIAETFVRAQYAIAVSLVTRDALAGFERDSDPRRLQWGEDLYNARQKESEISHLKASQEAITSIRDLMLAFRRFSCGSGGSGEERCQGAGNSA